MGGAARFSESIPLPRPPGASEARSRLQRGVNAPADQGEMG